MIFKFEIGEAKLTFEGKVKEFHEAFNLISSDSTLGKIIGNIKLDNMKIDEEIPETFREDCN